jgi:hypothetical protein
MKSKKASARVTSADQETAGAAGAASFPLRLPSAPCDC